MTSPETPVVTPLPAPPVPRPSSGFAIGALIAGIVAFLSGLAPVWGILAGGAAVSLGVIALMKKQGKGLAITGIVLGGMAVLASISTTLALAGIVVTSSPSALEPSTGDSSNSEADAPGTGSEPSASATPTETAEATPVVPAAPVESVSQSNAKRSADSYLQFSAFSRSGLIDQLIFEGFSTEDATYGVDAVGADWNEQAIASAKSYLAYSAFSHSGLVDQLVFEGFSPEEAEYGVTANGL